MHSEQPKLHRDLAVLSAVGLRCDYILVSYGNILFISEEFSLKIINLSLIDDDHYQCQVMATEDSSSLVSQFAYINVLGKLLGIKRRAWPSRQGVGRSPRKSRVPLPLAAHV